MSLKRMILSFTLAVIVGLSSAILSASAPIESAAIQCHFTQCDVTGTFCQPGGAPTNCALTDGCIMNSCPK